MQISNEQLMVQEQSSAPSIRNRIKHLRRFIRVMAGVMRYWMASGNEEIRGISTTDYVSVYDADGNYIGGRYHRYEGFTYIWRVVKHFWEKTGVFDVRRSVALSVIGNTTDAPCKACGGQCCTIPQPQDGGFNTVHVYSFEEIITRHPDMLRPTSSVGDYSFSFDPVTKRCPFLSADNRCSIYTYRPVACRNFACTDALSVVGHTFCSGEFYDRNSSVRAVLEREGFKKAVLPPESPETIERRRRKAAEALERMLSNDKAGDNKIDSGVSEDVVESTCALSEV